MPGVPAVFGVVLTFCLILCAVLSLSNGSSADADRRARDERFARMRKIYREVRYCSRCSIVWVSGRQSVYDPSELAVILRGAR
jgi:hypothetical protein